MYQTKELLSIHYTDFEVFKLHYVHAMCFREVKNLCQDSDKKKNLGNIHKSKAAETLVTDTDNKMCMPLLCLQSKQQPHEHGHISLPFTSSQFTPR